MASPVVYDKAKYHQATIDEYGLPDEQASVHTALFLGWLMEQGHLSEEFMAESREDVTSYRRREVTAIQVYQNWDCCLVDDMLSDTGNAFAQEYFDFEKGKYLADYGELLVKDLPSEFHVPYTWAIQSLMSSRIDTRFREWIAARGGDLRE